MVGISEVTIATIILAVLGLGALLLYALAESALAAVFGYIGAGAVWLISFGRVRLEPLRGGESELSIWLGVMVTVVVVVGVCSLIQRS